MTLFNWQLSQPISAVIFDCDGTLSKLEGIDYLAENNGVGEKVKKLTARAMGEMGLTRELYRQRLNLVKPHQKHVLALGHEYFAHRVADIYEVITLLNRLNKSVYIMSAGLYPAVAIFGNLLKIPKENIFAVNVLFDQQGRFQNFDENSLLIHNDGKQKLVKQLLNQHQHMLYLGDGLNDLVVKDWVTRFVGYGGMVYRENIAKLCDYYIQTLSLSPLLPLTLTQHEYETCLEEDEKILYQQGLSAILHQQKVKIK